jgi:serine/threonine protein kinase
MNTDTLLSWEILEHTSQGIALGNETREISIQGIAVEYLNKQGIAHNHFNPENVMIDSEGHAKLVNVGDP